jgi:hypothetical protein
MALWRHVSSNTSMVHLVVNDMYEKRSHLSVVSIESAGYSVRSRISCTIFDSLVCL